MNRETIIQMAREAGIEVHEHKGQIRIGSAILIGCDSTEAVLKLVHLATQRAVAEEREECAKVCESMHDEDRPTDYAWAIRARVEA